MEPVTILSTILTGLAFGAVYGLYGYLTKKEPGEGFEPRKLTRTAVVWALAGALVALGPSEVAEGNIEEKAASIGAIGIFVDQLFIWYEKNHGSSSED